MRTVRVTSLDVHGKPTTIEVETPHTQSELSRLLRPVVRELKRAGLQFTVLRPDEATIEIVVETPVQPAASESRAQSTMTWVADAIG